MANELGAPVYGADVTWGNHGKDIVVSRFWEVYFNDIMRGPDEVIYEKSVFTLDDSKLEDEGVFSITIVPDATLKAEYPEGLVVIDGKWYDLAALNNPITLSASAPHRIQIVWSVNELVETFVVKAAC